jgi:5-oxoprolinase (ATP-hydrolysing) subunit A
MQTIDINCDMGESTHLWPWHIDNDLALLPYTSSINIACGMHAGDPYTMHKLVEEALYKNIAVGAHPGFADRDNFGRSNQSLSPVKLYDLLLYQLGALDAFLHISGTRLHHVKPHGALYNMAASDDAMAYAVCKAVKEYDPALLLYGLSGSALIKAAHEFDLPSCNEVFADRSYQQDGSLTPRNAANALIQDEARSLQQVLQMAISGTVTTLNGTAIPVQAGTVCIHSDGEHALAFAKNMHTALIAQGISITSP